MRDKGKKIISDSHLCRFKFKFNERVSNWNYFLRRQMSDCPGVQTLPVVSVSISVF